MHLVDAVHELDIAHVMSLHKLGKFILQVLEIDDVLTHPFALGREDKFVLREIIMPDQ
jgi:hypothetical protein